ncbi:MAG: nucleotidyltransferase [Phycisphaera sp.]|nr:MAG: nucleotidyltransferase [Phycisphaera sp.]
MIDETVVNPYLDAHPSPVLFVTVSGAHLYGFASKDSDYDIRGCHLTPTRELLRLSPPRETYEVLDRECRIEMDIVTHDAGKFFRMLLNKNGYVLEQIFSPIVVRALPEFEELKSIARKCITRHHHHHFRSFATHQWKNIAGSSAGTVKGLLYTYRPLMAGIHLMQTGEVESNLATLNERFGFTFIDELIDRKVNGGEKDPLGDDDMSFHEHQFEKLQERLMAAGEASDLPDTPSARSELDDFLVRLRLQA